MLTTTWDANTVAQMTDVLVPQIEYFVRVGLIEPSHEASRRGVSRRYDLRRVFEIAVAGELLAAGITVVQINGALRVLRQEWLHLCNPKTRRSVGVLVLWRTPNDRRQTPATVSPRIGPANELLPLVEAGNTIQAAVSLQWMAKQLESVTGQVLA